VWTFEKDQWKPTLVILRINRAATCCQWSPKEDKFAVGTGAKCISVCYFENDNNWWVSKHIGSKAGIDSTIVSVDWHPNNVLIAAAGTDNKARVVSGFVKGLDTRMMLQTLLLAKSFPLAPFAKSGKQMVGCKLLNGLLLGNVWHGHPMIQLCTSWTLPQKPTN